MNKPASTNNPTRSSAHVNCLRCAIALPPHDPRCNVIPPKLEIFSGTRPTSAAIRPLGLRNKSSRREAPGRSSAGSRHFQHHLHHFPHSQPVETLAFARHFLCRGRFVPSPRRNESAPSRKRPVRVG